MRIITANVNGIRSAARKGFFDWLPQQQADVICLQEVRAQLDQMVDPVFAPKGYHCYHHVAEKKGYSGVSIYSKRAPDKVISKLKHDVIDGEARWLEARFGDLSVVSAYFPSGSSGDARQAVKMDCLDHIEKEFTRMKRRRHNTIVCGDWNIAHTKEDIRNWRGNQKNSGFLPEERAWLDGLFHRQKFVDSFRELEQEEHSYTWWSNRGQAWANNVGWRLDYQVMNPRLRGKVLRTEVYKDERFSDHAPYIVDYDLEDLG
ncbi:MAG: exodeoxyribonuclease III [Granulosicoccaceae bacterium]